MGRNGTGEEETVPSDLGHRKKKPQFKRETHTFKKGYTRTLPSDRGVVGKLSGSEGLENDTVCVPTPP